MPEGRGDKAGKILSSQWDGLSPHLIARFYPVKRMKGGSGWGQGSASDNSDAEYVFDNGNEVHAPISDGSCEISLNWNSPFENAGPESKAPALAAMLQSGASSAILQALGQGDSSLAKFTEELNGRTGITKLNSTQIFTGMPPVKFPMTLHFRALRDAVAEVQQPIAQLEAWAVPQFLADDSMLSNFIKNGAKEGIIKSAFPSKSPQILGFRYGDMVLQPVVIESISRPITAPRTQDGVLAACSVQLQISTLHALDRRDIKTMYL